MYTLALGPEWLSPDYLISHFGLIGILVIVFAESGLFAFLPGDSLLSRRACWSRTGSTSSSRCGWSAP